MRLGATVEASTSEDGLSLVEIMIALLLMGVVLTALASTAIASLSSLGRSEARQIAYTEATASLEQLRDYDWEDVRLPPAGIDPFISGDEFDPIEGTIADQGTGEILDRIPADVGVQLDDVKLADPVHQDDRPGRRLRTYVTEIDERQRRITAVVEFDQGGQIELVRQSTIVTRNVRYGVQQPEYAVKPIVGNLLMQRGENTCVTHRITNRGVPDSYRVEWLPTPGYLTTVFEDEDDDGVPDDDEQLTGFTSLDSPYGVGESFNFIICYQAASDAETPGELSLNVASHFVESDVPESEHERLTQEIVHNLEIEDERTLYLSLQRSDDAGSGPLPLLGEEPLDTTLEPADPTVSTRPGLTIARNEQARWRTTLNQRRTIVEADLRLWMRAAPLPDTEEEPGTANVQLELRRVAASGDVVHTLAIQSLAVPSGDWSSVVLDDLLLSGNASERTIESGQSLELVARCPGDSQRECELAFDTVSFPASLRVVFP